MAKHNEIGKIGEDIGSEWLKRRSFEVIDRNYSKKWGEIDIVARETGGKVHFIEVKTVSYETKRELEASVSHGTWRPEENVHIQKQERLKRAIETWIMEHEYKGLFQIDVLAIRVVPREKLARVTYLENVIFE